MTAAETDTQKKHFLDLVATAVTIVGEDISAGPFKNVDEMRDKFAKLNVDGYDDIGEKPDEILK